MYKRHTEMGPLRTLICCCWAWHAAQPQRAVSHKEAAARRMRPLGTWRGCTKRHTGSIGAVQPLHNMHLSFADCLHPCYRRDIATRTCTAHLVCSLVTHQPRQARARLQVTQVMRLQSICRACCDAVKTSACRVRAMSHVDRSKHSSSMSTAPERRQMLLLNPRILSTDGHVQRRGHLQQESR